MKCKVKMKTISKEVSGERQSTSFKEICKIEGISVRILIKVDSIDFQSKAVVDVFSTTDKKWNRVDYIPYSNMTSLKKISHLAFESNPNPKSSAHFRAFEEDAKILKDRASDILLTC